MSSEDVNPVLTRLSSWEKALESEIGMKRGESWQFRAFASVSSTMDVAREFARELTGKQFALVMSQTQEKGRGRQGREWDSPDGGFWGTFILHGGDVGALSGLSLVVGCVLLRTFRKFLGDNLVDCFSGPVGLKWPNDIVTFDGNKLAGVLVELIGDRESSTVLIGIGANLKVPGQHYRDRISLEELAGAIISPVEFASQLVQEVERAWKVFLKGGFEAFRDEWHENAQFLNRRFRVDASGQELVGKFIGVNKYGHLQLETESGLVELVSGHVLEIF